MFVGDDGINWTIHWVVEQADSEDFDSDPREAFDYFLDLLPRGTFKVLEIGCGIGKWYPVWKKLGAIYEGLDACKEAIEIARKRHPEVKFYCMRAEEMNFENEYDVIFTHTVLQHISHENKKKIFPRIHKALKNNGLLVIQEKCDVDTNTTFTRENWIKFVTSFGFEFVRFTDEGDPRNGFVFKKKTNI